MATAADSPFRSKIAGRLCQTCRVLPASLRRRGQKRPAIERFVVALLFACFLLPGCAYFSKSGRQQMAYQRYVKKCAKIRKRQRGKIVKEKSRVPRHKESDWQVTSGVVTESVSAGE